MKNQHLLTMFTPQEVLQQQYDNLKEKHEHMLSMETDRLRNVVDSQEIQTLKK